MTVEASLRLPQGLGDVDRFIQEFRIGKEAEATGFHALLEQRHCEAVRQEMQGSYFPRCLAKMARVRLRSVV